MQSGQRVERAREVVAGAVKDRPPVFVEGGREGGRLGFWGDCGACGLAGRRRWAAGGRQDGFLTKRL